MKTITLICKQCGHSFERRLYEHTRNEKLGRLPFCNLSCFGKYTNQQRPKDFGKKLYAKQKKTFDIKKFCGNRRDVFSPFRLYLGKGRASIVKHRTEIDIDEKYLKEIWDSQKGICPYTGIIMELMETSSKHHRLKSLKKASLDRIDSSKGYIKGNVEFVCMAINNAKNSFSKNEMLSFIEEIRITKKESGGAEQSRTAV